LFQLRLRCPAPNLKCHMKSQFILVAHPDQIHSNQGLADFIPRMSTHRDTFFNG
jgi:hypothetical protein